jgi:hypothetical protein
VGGCLELQLLEGDAAVKNFAGCHAHDEGCGEVAVVDATVKTCAQSDQPQCLQLCERKEWKRLEWIGAKQEFGLCCSLQEWLMMDGIEAVDVAED